MNLRNIILEKLILPIGDFFNKSSFIEKLNILRNEAKFSNSAISQLQKTKINKLIEHAVNNVPFYQNLRALKNQNSLDIKSFPIIDKNILSEKQDQLLAQKKR